MEDSEQRELLYRIDERTEAIDSKLDVIDGRVSATEDDIDNLQGMVQRNTTVLGGVATGITAVLIWMADKVTRII